MNGRVVWMRNGHIAFILHVGLVGGTVDARRKVVALRDPGNDRIVRGEVLAVGQIDGTHTVIVQAAPGS